MASKAFNLIHMKRSRYTRLITLILLLYADYHTAGAQSLEGRLSGTSHEIHSDILNETRAYWVSLPDGYEESKAKNVQYPVIYVLDGEKYFPVVTGVLDFLSNGNRSPFQKCIVVGIMNTDRTRDLTPTAAVSARGGATLTNSGGGPQFARFIASELVPAAEEKLRTNSRRIVIGHSFGGLEATYLLLHHPTCFSDYLLFDPSLWWDDFSILDCAGQMVAENYQAASHANVFIGFGGEARKSPYHGLERDLSVILQNHAPDRWQIRTKWYPNESHGTIFVPALYDGLRMILRAAE